MPMPPSPPRASPLNFSKMRLYFGWLNVFIASERRAPALRVPTSLRNFDGGSSSAGTERQMKGDEARCMFVSRFLPLLSKEFLQERPAFGLPNSRGNFTPMIEA